MIPIEQIYVVDDDAAVRDSLTLLLETHDFNVRAFESGDVFLSANPEQMNGVVLLDIRMPGRNGIEVLDALKGLNPNLYIIMMSGHADISMAVKAIKKGAFDFIEKPFHVRELIPVLERVGAKLEVLRVSNLQRDDWQKKLDKLTARERQVMTCIVDGKPNKIIANDLGISVRTVETHRAKLMLKLDVGSVSELVKLSIKTP